MMVRFTGVMLILALVVLPLVAQDAATPSPDAVTPSEVSATSTPEPSATLVAATATASVTAIPTNTVEPSPVPETAPATDAVTPTDTDIPEITAIVETDILPTDAIIVPSSTATPTMIGTATDALSTAAFMLVQGSAEYQQHVTNDHSGILIEVFSAERALLSSALTDTTGRYEIAVPHEPYWLVASAVGHQQVAGVIQTGALPVPLVLPGGDLDADGCITAVDLDMLLNHLDDITVTPDADLNQDGETTIADLAILAGNVKPMCEIFIRTQATLAAPTPTSGDAAVLTAVATSTPTETPVTDAGVPAATDVTPFDVPLVTISPTVELAVTDAVPNTDLPGSTPTATPSFEAPPEAGVIVTEDQKE